MSDILIFLPIILNFIQFFTHICSSEIVIEYSEDNKPCTYFAATRYAAGEPGLVNCSWYASRSCCKRTEVTSVFSANILPLYQASTDCQNKMNYMMCYFCSPDQCYWYKEGKVHIAETFCASTYKACASAFYNGTRLGSVFLNHTALCENQNFKVVNSKHSFKYDPTVFDNSHPLTGSLYTTVLVTVLALFGGRLKLS